MRSPTEIHDEGTYWLRSRDVSDSPLIGGEQYFSDHDVPRAEECTSADLPPADDEAVRAIDEEALANEQTIGKWQVTGSAERVDDLWPDLLADAEKGILWAVKAMTGFGHEELPMYDEYVITVYTPNYFAKHDVDRVREHLRAEHDVTRTSYYKPDIYTKKGIDRRTVDEFGLSVPARYVA